MAGTKKAAASISSVGADGKQPLSNNNEIIADLPAQGNPRVYKALKNQMAETYEELQRITNVGELNDELLYTLQLIAETMNGLKEDR